MTDTAVHTSPFDLDDEATYRDWRAWRLAQEPRSADELVVPVADPRHLAPAERAALLARVARCNMAVYATPAPADGDGADKTLVAQLAAQLGLHQLDANWLADEDGISSITPARGVPAPGAAASDSRGSFIPYTTRPINWHTDGYYHPEARRIRAMILHCVRPAADGGVNTLLDHERAYIALRDESPAHIHALMRPDVMVIPAREDDDGVARPAQAGPVFSVDPHDGTLHMRYTARTRSIEWRDDDATRAARAALDRVLAGHAAPLLRLHLRAGMGLVANNVLHDRSGFSDDPARPRLLYRARYLDRIATGEPWRSG